MLAKSIRKTFLRAVHGEITEDEATDRITDSIFNDPSANSQNHVNGFQFQQKQCRGNKTNITGQLQQQLQQQQQKVLGTVTLGDLQPAQIAQFQEAFAEASKGLPSSVVFTVPAQNAFNPEEVFTDNDKERCSLLQELITGQRPVVAHPYVFLLNRRFKWTDIAVPVTNTDKFRVYRLNQARNARCYYRCSGCETMAKEVGDPIAQIKLAGGHLAGDVNPVHNAKCELFTFSSILTRQFDREARLEVYNGIMSPRNAWNRGRLRSLRAESLAPKGLVNAADYPTWETMNKIIMKLWRSAKRAHDAGIEVHDRVGVKDWWRNITPPMATRKNTTQTNYESTNYDLPKNVPQSGEIQDYGGDDDDDDENDGSCITMAASDGTVNLDIVDVVSENEAYATDQEPAPSVSFGRGDICQVPPEEISLFSNVSDSNKQDMNEDRDRHVSMLPTDTSNKETEIFMDSSGDNVDVQYYLMQDDDDDEEEDDGDDDDNDVDVDNSAEDGDDDEVMREYHDILTEVQQLEKEAKAATAEACEHQKITHMPGFAQSQYSQSYALRRDVQQITLRERANAQQRLNSAFLANRKLFAAIESLTRTLNADHSRQFHQEMLKTAVELSNFYAAQQYNAAAAASVRRNTAFEQSDITISGRRHSDIDDNEKIFGNVIGRRQSAATPLRTWSFKKRTKFE